MGKKSEPNITKCKKSDNWTKVSFKPDLAKFNMTHLEEDVVALMKKRVVDIAGCLGRSVKVKLNGERVRVKSFSDYVDLYLKTANKNRVDPLPKVVGRVNNRWDICVSLSEGQFQQVSFVNGIATIKGGTHVDYVTNQLTNHVITVVNKKKKNLNLKAHAVKSHLWVFVNALIDNPTFDTQTKETLKMRQSSFGSKCELSEGYLKKVVLESGIVDTLLSKDLKNRVTGIPELEDANKAGGSQSNQCTLILTEGDSAKSLAMAGLSIVGREHYGVFPSRGKLLNVKQATEKQITKNAEIQKIMKIVGLERGKVYDNVKSLRYGHLMIMTDQDHDGSHIKGLLIKFIHSFWPSLLKIQSFIQAFITPILKATKNDEELSFYSILDYEKWKDNLGAAAISSWKPKYYKGLGTSTSKEGKLYFTDLEKHMKEFLWDGDAARDAIELAFSKKKIEARKEWLKQDEPGTSLDKKEKLIKYSDFIYNDLRQFSMADLRRSIPSVVDGLKPAQRKILFCSFKKEFTEEGKVEQFSSYVSANSAYRHGENNLASTIVRMAQDFVGSNNINLLLPRGQFGTRNHGRKEHGRAAYINTQLAPITRNLFHKDDDVLLQYLYEDGENIEPSWYVPVVPMVLVNGADGLGTAYSTHVPNYNPREIVANIRRLLNGEPLQPMDPWYKGFRGTIEKSAKAGQYTVSGLIEEIDDTHVTITELPVGRWTHDYMEFLESSVTGNNKKKESFIKDYNNQSDDCTVQFNVEMTDEGMLIARQEGLLKFFDLTTTISTSNMHLFDPKGVIKKYDTPEQILEDFYPVRLDLYDKRQKVVLENLELDLLKLDNIVRFIQGAMDGKFNLFNRKADLPLFLKENNFAPFPEKNEVEENSEGGGGEEAAQVGDYDYLTKLEWGAFCSEELVKLLKERDKLEGEIKEAREATPISLWKKDLDALDEELDDLMYD